MLHLKGLQLETVGEHLWRGKVFFRDERVLRNRIDDIGLLKTAGLVQGEPKKMKVGDQETWLLFPAKLYCGQSLMDSRRESVIIDYFFTDEIAGYQEMPDFVAGRRGLKVRDEIRMVRPGFYLGRAYLDRAFGLNFTLYNKAVAETRRRGVPEDRADQRRLLGRHPAAAYAHRSRPRPRGDQGANRRCNPLPDDATARCGVLCAMACGAPVRRHERNQSCVR